MRITLIGLLLCAKRLLMERAANATSSGSIEVAGRVLLAGAFERATGRAAGITRVGSELTFTGPFLALVEQVSNIIAGLGARSIPAATNYARGRRIERWRKKTGFVD
jgi:hypothetical protein